MGKGGGFLDTVRFVVREALLGGGFRYYAAFTGLLVVALYGLYLWVFVQHAPVFLGARSGGLILTGLSDSVPWGIYISFFIFWVGVAAASIAFSVAAYVFGDKEFKKFVVVGEVQAVAALVTAITLVLVDLGRPLRALVLLPRLPNLRSMLDWDFVVLFTYLALNLAAVLVTVHYYRAGRSLPRSFIVPYVVVSAPFAIGIHTVTAFISQALTARPIWNTGLLAPRYIATAFASGPAILLITLYLAERYTRIRVDFSVYRKTLYLVVGALVVGLYFTLSEVQEVFWYTAEPIKRAQALELFLGYHLPYLAVLAWLWISLGTAAAVLGAIPRIHNSREGVLLVSLLAVAAVVSEKTMTIVVPAFTPNTLGMVVPYYPTPVEVGITVGVHALGLLVYLALARAALKAIEQHYYRA